MKKTLSDEAGQALLELEQFLYHAAAYWQSYWSLDSREAHERYSKVFESHEWWYITSREAYFLGAIISIAKLLETNDRSVNLSHFIDILSRLAEWKEESAEMRKLLASEATFVRDIALLRSNYYAHKSRNLSFTDMMKKTSLTYADVPRLVSRLAAITNICVHAVSGQSINPESISERTREEMEKLLNKLN